MTKVVKTQVEFEGKVSEHVAIIEGPEPDIWSQNAEMEVVGAELPRVDGFERVTGAATYTLDVQLPGMLHGRCLRSPFPHARITSIDASRASGLHGVRAILTHVNAPDITWKDGKSLLDSLLQCVGDEVAVVVADDEQIAEDALHLIDVNYQELPSVLDPEKALQQDAPLVHPTGNLVGGKPRLHERGDIQQGLADAEVTVEETFRTQVAVQNPLEPHCTVADWKGEDLTIWDSTQTIFGVRSEVAEMLDVPLNRVHVVSQYIGGGFGSKQEISKQTVLAAVLSRETGRPVRIALTREEESLITAHRHETIQHLKLGARKDGTLTAIELRCLVPVGTYGYASPVDGPANSLYQCPNVRTELLAIRTNRGPARAFRGPGYAEGMFGLESAMDMLAERLGMDPLELRLKNYAEKDPVTGRDYSAKHLREAYHLAAEKAGWSTRGRQVPQWAGGEPAPGGKKRGLVHDQATFSAITR